LVAQTSQQALQRLRCEPERLQVELVELAAEESIPNAAPDEAHGSTSRRRGPADLQYPRPGRIALEA